VFTCVFAKLHGRINSVTYGANERESVDDALWILRNNSSQHEFIGRVRRDAHMG
jgi:hypothetical protein